MSDQIAFPDKTDQASAAAHRLLAIDDDSVHRLVICRIAAQAGFEVEEAASYEASCRMLSQGTYACATLDLSLGKHGGVDVLRHMAEIGYVSPVIVVSGSDDAARDEASALARALSLNVCRTFSKPVKLAELRELMREIRKRRPAGLTQRGS